MRSAQKGQAKLIAVYLREAAMNPVVFYAAVVITLVTYVLFALSLLTFV